MQGCFKIGYKSHLAKKNDRTHLGPDGDVQGEVLLEVADVLPHRRHLHLLVVLALGTLDVKVSKNS